MLHTACMKEKSTVSFDKPIEADKPRRKSMFTSYYDDMLGIALTLGAGLGTGWLMINKYFFRNGEKEGRFEQARKTRNEEFAKLKVTGDEWLRKRDGIEKVYYEAVENEMRQMGIHDPISKFRSLAKHQKWEVAIAMTAVTGAAIGFISNYISNREGTRQQQEILDALNRMEENSHSRLG